MLRRLVEPGAVLAIAPEMDKAVILRELPDGRSLRTAVIDRAVAQACILKDWIACTRPGRIARYELTPAGRDLRAVQELLGHANISTTQVYTRLDFQHLAKAYDAAHPRAKLKKTGGP